MADTNILISALLKEGVTREILRKLKKDIIFTTYIVKECEVYLPLIARKTGLAMDHVAESLEAVVQAATLLPDEALAPHRDAAHEALDHIDPYDAPILAAALAADADIWSDDKHFKQQRLVTVYTTTELLHVVGFG
ncbi:PIN domain-containing protein [Candidatus Woesearchaeota archaeon]|nr:PIN domain-containing protein [Candidatus Woesearchaeota archaeon]